MQNNPKLATFRSAVAKAKTDRCVSGFRSQSQVSGFSPVSSLSPASGQALVEFCVGLVCIMAILVTLLQVASISRIRTDLMADARRTAGEESLKEDAETGNAEFIGDWDVGVDGVRYSADDEPDDTGDSSGLQTYILDYSVADPSEWERMEDIPNNPFAETSGGYDPGGFFGLINAEAFGRVTNNGAFQGLVYNADTIDFDVSVWMTWTTGFYE